MGNYTNINNDDHNNNATNGNHTINHNDDHDNHNRISSVSKSGQHITHQISQKQKSIGKCHRKSIGQFHYKSTGQVTILWKIPQTSDTPLENDTGNPLEHAIEHPR